MNITSLIGRITNEPELRTTSSKLNVSSFTLAINGAKNDKGEYRTDFIPITIFGKQAENLCEYVHKGDLLAVSGRIQSSSYEDKDNNKRTKIEIVANNIHYLSTKKKEGTFNVTKEIQYDEYEDFNSDVTLSDDMSLPF